MPYTYIQRIHRSGLGSRSSSGYQQRERELGFDGCFKQERGQGTKINGKTEEACESLVGDSPITRETVGFRIVRQSIMVTRNGASVGEAKVS